MEAPPGAGVERRCPSCGALVTSDAEWCGQCFEPLRAPDGTAPHVPTRQDSQPATGTPREGPESTPAPTARVPSWPCPTCGTDNSIERDLCVVCGTSFAALMRSDEKPPPVDPRRALRRSLLFPGLGHRLVGRPLDGLARGALFAILAGMTLLAILSGAGTATLIAVLVLFATMTLVVYLGSAWEAYRLAAGHQPFMPSRILLWGAVGAIMLSVALLALAVASAARR